MLDIVGGLFGVFYILFALKGFVFDVFIFTNTYLNLFELS